MKRKRHSPDEIRRKLREAEPELAAGQPISAICQKLGITEATFHRWRSRYGGRNAASMPTPATGILLALFFGAGLPLLAMLFLQQVGWWLMESVTSLRWFYGSAVGLSLLAGLLKLLLQRAGGTDSTIDRNPPGAETSRVSKLAGWALVPVVLGLAVGSEISTNLAASHVHTLMRQRFPDHRELYVNHDVAKLVGETLRAITLRLRSELGDPDEKCQETLQQIAGLIPELWMKLAIEIAAQESEENEKKNVNEQREVALFQLTEAKLWSFIQDPSEEALDERRWYGLIDQWTSAAGAKALPEACRQELARRYTKTFAYAFREALKHDYTLGGKAVAAMQLDMFGELLKRTAAGAPQDDPAVQEALRAQQDASKPVFDQLTRQIEEEFAALRKGLDQHARAVLDQFEQWRSEWQSFRDSYEKAQEQDAERHEELMEFIRELRAAGGPHAPLPEALRLRHARLMIEAVNSDDAACVALLIGEAPEVRVDPNRETLVHLAARKNARRVLPILLRSGIAIDAPSGDGQRRTALHIASVQGHLEVAAALLAAGADAGRTTLRGETALHLAAGNDQAAEVVRLLLDHGLDVNLANRGNDEAPLHVAMREHAWRCAAILLEQPRIDVNARDSHGNTPLLALARTTGDRRPAASFCAGIELLRARGADLQAANARGETARELIAAAQRPEIVECFEVRTP